MDRRSALKSGGALAAVSLASVYAAAGPVAAGARTVAPAEQAGAPSWDQVPRILAHIRPPTVL